jgi:hypothetical protein
MFQAFVEKPTIEYVSEKCGIHHATCRRYRVIDRWDARLAEVRATAQRTVDYDLAAAMAQSLGLIRSYKDKLGAAMLAKTVEPGDITIADLERLVRLEAFVLGAAESRHEVVTTFSQWTEEELARFVETGERPVRPSGSASRA